MWNYYLNKREIYIYEGLGFPVELKAVKMIYLDKDWQPKIKEFTDFDTAYEFAKNKFF